MTHKKKVRFIVNPISGVGRQKIIEKLAKQHIDSQRFDIDIYYTNAPKHATELAKNAVLDKIDIVAVVGGDGSVNEVGKGLIGSTTAMAIIPAGSGNGLARHLAIPIDLKKAIQLINTGSIKTIDAGCLNDEVFFNVAGVGFDALIAYEFSQYGKRGFWSYVKIFFREYPSYFGRDFKLTIDDNTITRNAFLITIANGTQFGNNAYIAPQANSADGLLNVVIIKNIHWYNFLYVAYTLFRRNIHTTSHCETILAKKVEIHQLDNFAHIDGDPITSGQHVSIHIAPLSLNIITP
jgi:diacylglycerol kinase (ATP)